MGVARDAVATVDVGDDVVPRVTVDHESAGRASTIELTGLPNGSKLWETNIIEDVQGEISADNGRASLTFRPWQVRTFLVTT